MLIDWVTASLDMEKCSEDLRENLMLLGDRVLRYCPRTGVIKWESCAWDSIRSDSHQLAFRVSGSAIHIQGSPARVCGSGDAVFGEGAARALDLPACLSRMVAFISGMIGHNLPAAVELWKVSRVDVTANLLLDDLASVRVALRILRECEGGRYRVSQQAGDTVYWSHRSRLRSAKAYAKGPHIRYQIAQTGYTGRAYTSQELSLLDRLLRLELKLGAQWLRERAGKAWHKLTPDDLRGLWHEYFEKMIGDASMTEESLYEKICEAAELIRLEKNITSKVELKSSEGMAKTAYAFYLLIQKEGWQRVRELHSKKGKPSQTYYRNLNVLHRAGLGDADISAGTVVVLRRKIIECQIIESWDDLRKAA